MGLSYYSDLRVISTPALIYDILLPRVIHTTQNQLVLLRLQSHTIALIYYIHVLLPRVIRTAQTQLVLLRP